MNKKRILVLMGALLVAISSLCWHVYAHSKQQKIDKIKQLIGKTSSSRPSYIH